jgi:glutathione synthase/RimK-type ligase-like ATP-grasp enzyme
MRAAILTCESFPSFITWEIPDSDSLFADDRRLIAEFGRRGVDADFLPWSRAGVDWGRYDVALIRSTWDYIDHREHFLEVLSSIERSGCRLFNPLETVRWNSEKTYLLDLQARGIPTVPTELVRAAGAREVEDVVRERGWDRVVVKPTVGAAGAGVRLVPAAELAGTIVALPAGDYLLQPFVESISSEGELSFVYIDGRFSHALLKRPAEGDYRTPGIYGGTERRLDPAAGDLAAADAMMVDIPFDSLYARLDLVRVDGRLVVMEVELVEPVLFFGLAPEAVGRLVDATLTRTGAVLDGG